MRIEQLEALVKVADDASMHKAADALHTSTQNVSKQIKQLEIELGASLLTRSNSGTFLTEDGEYLYHKALDILDVVEEINVNFRGNPPRSARVFVLNRTLRCAYRIFVTKCRVVPHQRA